MSILVFIDTDRKGHPTNYALQSASYASMLADELQTESIGVASEKSQKLLEALAKVGISKMYVIPSFSILNGEPLVAIFEKLVESLSPQAIIFSHDFIGKIIAPQLSAKLGANLVMGAIKLPIIEASSWLVQRTAFSGKVSQILRLVKGLPILTVQPNAFQQIDRSGIITKAEVFNMLSPLPSQIISLLELKFLVNKVPLSDAEKVISGGMGMQSPDNWYLLEKLAEKMGGALACTRPVSDAGWRPHYEHVGQTGTTVAPRLYMAVGISGAIQHVAGMNQSNVIVAINKDPEAPIFKIADYAIVGDALEVLPRLIESIP